MLLGFSPWAVYMRCGVSTVARKHPWCIPMMELKCLVAGGKPGATPGLENHRSRPLRMPEHSKTAQGENPSSLGS